MIALFCLCLALFVSPLKSKSRLEAKNAALRHQLIMLRRKVRGRVRLTGGDRFLHPAVSMVSDHPQCHYNCSPRDPRAMAPSRLPPVLALEIPLPWGRPQIDAELRALIRRSLSPAWRSTWSSDVAPPSQGWRTFLRNHAPDIAAMDLFVVEGEELGSNILQVLLRNQVNSHAISGQICSAGSEVRPSAP